MLGQPGGLVIYWTEYTGYRINVSEYMHPAGGRTGIQLVPMCGKGG